MTRGRDDVPKELHELFEYDFLSLRDSLLTVLNTLDTSDPRYLTKSEIRAFAAADPLRLCCILVIIDWYSWI